MHHDRRVTAWEKLRKLVESGQPPPNHKKPPRLQHYVPRVYLRRFMRLADEHLRIVNVTENPPSARNGGLNSVAAEKDFYRVPMEDDRFENMFEHVCNVHEDVAGLAFQNLDARRSEMFDPVDRQNMSQFMALQLFRGADVRDAFTVLAREESERNLTALAATPGLVRRFVLPDEPNASDERVAAILADLADVQSDPVRLAQVLDDSVDRDHVVKRLTAITVARVSALAAALSERAWVIGISPIPLITSDCPVLIAYSRHATGPIAPGDVERADFVIFPLDTRRVLRMARGDIDPEEGVGHMPLELAEQCNRCQWQNARRWVIHHPDENPLEGLAVPPRPP